MKKGKLTPSSAINLIDQIVHTNYKLSQNGLTPIAINIEGKPGIAKTSATKQAVSIIKQTTEVEELKNLGYIKLSLSTMTPEDLLGYPVSLFELSHKVEIKPLEDGTRQFELKKAWIPKETLELFISKGYQMTGNHKMIYSVPEWVQPYIDSKKPVILNLDDFNRGNSAMMNAVMELCDQQTYGTWSLPKGSTVICTSNPDDGDYSVTITDDAQKTRMIIYEMTFSIKDWVDNATSEGMHDTLISFLESHIEVIEGATNALENTKDENDDSTTVKEKPNSRIWSKYFHLLTPVIEAYDKEEITRENLIEGIISLAGKSIPQEFVTILVSYLSSMINEVPTVEKFFDDKTFDSNLKNFISKTSSKNGKKTDLLGLFSKRLRQYCKNNYDKIDEKFVDKVKTILKSELFTLDLQTITIKTISEIGNKNPESKLKGIMMDSEIAMNFMKSLS